MRCINSDSRNCVHLGVLAASDDNSSGDAHAMGEMVTGEMVTSETRAIKSGGMSAKVIFMLRLRCCG